VDTLRALPLTRSDVFQRLVRTLEASKIPYCILGDTSGLPDQIASDVDIASEIASLDKLHALLTGFCAAESLRLIQMHQHERSAWYCSLAWRNLEGRIDSLQVDFCCDYMRLDRFYLPHTSLLDRRLHARNAQGRSQGFYVPSPPDAFIYYLLKHVDKASLTQNQCQHLTAQWAADPEAARRRIEQFWAADDSQLLAAAAESGAWDRVIAALPDLRRALHLRHPVALRDRAFKWRVRFPRILRPPGLSVGILCNDQTLRSALARHIHATFRASFFHINLISRPDSNCLAGKNRTAGAPTGEETRHWLRRAWSLCCGRLRLNLARAGLVLFEAAPEGFIPRHRSKLGGAGLFSLVARITPRPELCFHIKSAEGPEDPVSPLHQYFPNLCVCDGSDPVQVQNEISALITEYLSTRLERRLAVSGPSRSPNLASVEPSRGRRCGIPDTESRSLLGMRVDATCYEDLVEQVMEWARAGESRFVCEAPVHVVMEAHDDPRYREMINQADIVAPGGMPLVWALRRLGLPNQPRVYGPEIMLRVCAAAARTGVPIGLYGATDSTLRLLIIALQKRYPELKIAYSCSPPFRSLDPSEDATIIRDIKRSGCKLLFVGLGCPKQEKWMASHRGTVQAVMFGVGAAFDFISGVKAQAPAAMQNAGLEWLFRLATEPRRLWFRYLYHNPRFTVLLFLQLLSDSRSKVRGDS